jgi:uncharacterized Zn finger protein
MLTRTVLGSKGDTYIVTEKEGVWNCSCPHHTYRGARCKHIVQVQSTSTSTDTQEDIDMTQYDIDYGGNE